VHVIDTLAPVFLFVIIGAVMRSRSFLSQDFFRGANKLVFYLGLPAFLFNKIVSAEFNFKASYHIFLALIICMVISIAVAYLTCYLAKVPQKTYSSFVQVAFRGNTALVGIPVIVYALTGTEGENMIEVAIVALAPAIPIWNIVTLLLLIAHGNKPDGNLASVILFRVIKNPLVIACIAGVILALLPITIPEFIMRSCKKVGQMSLPLALLSIGASLTISRLRQKFRFASIASVIKVVFCPILGWWLSKLLGMNDQETLVTLVFLACPTAVSAYVMTSQMGGDEAVAGSGIVFSTLLSAIPLIIIVACLG